MKKKYIFILIVLVCFCFVVNTIYADVCKEDLLTCIIKHGNNVGTNEGDVKWGEGISSGVSNRIISSVKAVGYLVFAIVTALLGIKYMWSSYEGKSKVKETLPTFLVAIIFFYFADTIVTIIMGDNMFKFDNWNELSSNVYGMVAFVAQYLSFGTLLFIGLKYMFESSEGKAKVKETLFPLVLGSVFVFLSSTVVTYIVQAVDQVI